MDDLHIAAVCMKSVPGAVEQNLKRTESLIREAAVQGADVVCFPELSLTGYSLEPSSDMSFKHNEFKGIDKLLILAKETKTVVIAGFIESSKTERPNITQMIAGPEGLIGLYRKTHLPAPEAGVYQAGEGLEVYSHQNTTFGVQLCYEAHFPEISTAHALMGAEIIFFPHASPRGNPEAKLQSWLRHLTARAFDNGVFVVACNQVGVSSRGLTLPGVAVIIGPDGHVITSYAGQEEKILMAEIKGKVLKEIRQHRMKYFIPNRRPELYIINSGK